MILQYLLVKFQNNANQAASSKKKTKSSKSKTAKSKLASKILSSKTSDSKSAKVDDEGRDNNQVILDNNDVFGDTIKGTLLKDLKEADFVMETPSAAIFTLVVGKTLN